MRSFGRYSPPTKTSRMRPRTLSRWKAKGKEFKGLKFRIQVSPLDCTGCGNCGGYLSGQTKGPCDEPLETQTEAQVPNHIFSTELPVMDEVVAATSVKGSQFKQPLFEFSGACPGCGETPYIKLITQLYGDRC